MTFEDPAFPAGNFINSITSIRASTLTTQKCVASLATAIDPEFTSTLKASILIDGVAVISSSG
jgi:hypothetical protein